jgi:hypothetical protein
LQRTLCDLGRAKAGLDEDIAALGTEGSSDSLGQGVNTSQESSAALNAKLELLQLPVSRLQSTLRWFEADCSHLVSKSELLAKTGTGAVASGGRGQSGSPRP